ncbi:tyrosine-type recombinase/integrase [Nocardia tengchongensis]|uniref:Tyrosine-type recombinase/integrase n=1 Tax=Nocardia tengchongensis TaxID=2055889 RepID=A0ABX8D2I7_9NOCA|nr:tyrosine-type recombinase/integrase [Nocardia tengchongensis]QVI25299.1 tyrosine-type recombinase/integrase [Nocardia tengchongensis]
MLEGWRRQQSARFLSDKTVRPRLRLIQRLVEFTGLYPWQWTPAEGEAFIDHLRGGDCPRAMSTARGYEVTITLFLEFLLDPRYGWARVCEERFGEGPQQIFHEGNSILHKGDYEGDPRRRPLTYDEIQALFAAAEARPGRIAERGVKGALGAARDAAVLKTIYAYGLRRTETSKLDLVDLRRNAKMPQFGRFGSVMVRYGKASKGSAPKRRSVLLVPEMDWATDVLDEWLTELRPRFSPGKHPALWVTERVGRLSPRSINEAFVVIRRAADLDENLDVHCLRHSAITHWTEFGYPARFVQEQAGHSHAATTSIYMGVSNEFRNQLLVAALKGRLGDFWDVTA